MNHQLPFEILLEYRSFHSTDTSSACVCVNLWLCEIQSPANSSALFPSLDDRIWQMLRHSCTQKVLQLCLEICVPRQCQHAGIRPKQSCISQETEHLCFWRAMRYPTVLEERWGPALSIFKRLANLPLTKWSHSLMLHREFTKHCGDWLYKQIPLTRME